jgi:integrase
MLTGLRQGQMRSLRLSDWRDGEFWVPGAKGGRALVFQGVVGYRDRRSDPHPPWPGPKVDLAVLHPQRGSVHRGRLQNELAASHGQVCSTSTTVR